MTNSAKILRLKEIYAAAKKKRIVVNQTEFAKLIDYSRSQYSKMLKDEYEISDDTMSVAEGLLKNETKNVSRETGEIIYDSKESAMRMLEKALNANVEHAAANTKNAAASEKNATAMIELVRLLGVKLSSVENVPVSVSSQDSNDKPPLPEEQIPVFEGKAKNRSAQKKNK